MNALDPHLVSIVSEAVELATNVLSDLDSSVYVLLVDHLAFAVQRHRDGYAISNKLVDEIRIAFGPEFTAAQMMVHFVNENLNVELPIDEVAFIALHLNAARTGATVKQPLSEVNKLGAIVELITTEFNGQETAEINELLRTINGFITRIQAGIWRTNETAPVIETLLREEFSVAQRAITYIAQPGTAPLKIANEAAYLAVFLHGWRQSSTSAQNDAQ